MSQDYNKTVNLPVTEFPMRAGLPKREPDMLEDFAKREIYKTLMEKNTGKPKFILHDGPPYANNPIHIGTSLNKILKDIIVRHKNMTGFHAPYVPGWDTHGLPIESAVLKNSKVKREEMTTAEFRDKCRDFAMHWVGEQRKQFMRLGGIGDWFNPYLTLAPEFEANQIEVFGEMAAKGYIYKGLKPVYWCPSDETALAEAEIEYSDDPCTSIFVKFQVSDDKGVLSGCDLSKTFFVIWTTTPWTLTANLAISLNDKFEYALTKVGEETYIVAKELLEDLAAKLGWENYEVVATKTGAGLDMLTAKHPFYDRESLIVCGDHVTLEAGTGCVHTAPGFGAEDYAVCRNYDRNKGTNLGVMVTVNERGVMTEEAGHYAGHYYAKANDAIIEELKEKGALAGLDVFTHQYPHCWRCKKPIIYRATEQWFCSVNAFRDEAIAACEDVKWYPSWGKERMISMIADRDDWCISRQRQWGVPIPIFYCKGCGKDIVTPETIKKTADLFRKNGSNVWFETEADELVPEGFACPHCGHSHFEKETNIMDVWFDSGSTHRAVLSSGIWPELSHPADLYLEGGDQYRGWFQSSLLTSIATTGKSPFKQIVTHGWTVDGEGKAMHKSLGNAVAPEEVIKDYGADILRLWVCSTDYQQDMRISKEILKQLSDAYLKIRNTARYMLGNLDGFDPNTAVAFADMEPLDRWAVSALNDLSKKVRDAYEIYEFHTAFRSIYSFCVVELSNFYLDIIKDRLYCEDKDGGLRRSAQSAMYRILSGMTRMLAPMLAFTSEEIWASMTHDASADTGSVLYNDMPAYCENLTLTAEEAAKWTAIQSIRTDVNKALELARGEKTIGKSLEGAITLYTEGFEMPTVSEKELEELCIVSKVTVKSESGEGYQGELCPNLKIAVARAEAPKCIRCWNHREDVGSASEHPELCKRCATVVLRSLS